MLKMESCETEIQLRDQLIDAGSETAEKPAESTDLKDLVDRRVIKMLGKEPKLSLPPGWLAVNHQSGGLVYLHKESRVVTWSRPYHIGVGSLRKHDVPLIAIPCLHQLLCENEETNQRRKVKKRKLEHWKMSKGLTSKRMRADKNGAENTAVENDSNEQNMLCKDTETTHSTDKFNLISTKNNDISESREATFFSDVSIEENSSITTDFQHGTHEDNSDLNATETFNENSLCNGLSRTKSSLGDNKDKYSTLIQISHKSVCKDECYQKSPIAKFDSQGLEQVNSNELHKYLSRIFEFKTLSEDGKGIPIFHDGSLQVEEKLELPENLQTIPHLHINNVPHESKNDGLCPAGKTHLSILNEYCQGHLKKKLNLIDAETVGDLFVVEAEIDGVKYGKGEGQTKKLAKQNAAKKTMEIFMPKQFNEINDFVFSKEQLQVLDHLDIDDPSIYDCTKKLGFPLPSEVLSTCLKRNRGLCPPTINFKLTPSAKNDPHQYEIQCGKHTAMGLCKNRKIGKQLASQALLKKIHPRLEKWGQLIRMYCDAPTNLIKETNQKVSLDQEISRMQSSDSRVLEKLREEMRELKSKKQSKLDKDSATISSKELDF